MEREFYYKGYLINVFDNYTHYNLKWVAFNTNDCDEPRIIEKTFEDILNEIDERNEQTI